MYEQGAVSTQEERYPDEHDREGWRAFWAERGRPWRTEPEIDAERQAELTARLAITPHVEQGIYPFRKMKLNRADIEWLLATHEHGRGPVDYHDPVQRERVGLDLRGADLSYTQLQNLPLTRTVGDVTWRTWTTLTEKQHRMAAVHLQHADLKGAYLEGSSFEYADMEGADLRGCHLEDANLGTVNLKGAYCEGAHLEGVDFWLAHLEGAFLWRTYLQGTRFSEARLDGAHLDHPVFVDERGIGPHLVDTHWGDVILANVHWSEMRMPGDEYQARQKTRDGQPKDRETRLIEFENAVRANRQLAVALQTQGLNEDAARFVYHAQVLQRKVLALQGPSKFGPYLFSLFLAMLTGYGYRMWRILIAYALLISLFATLYFALNQGSSPSMAPLEAIILSITAFHGRVFSSPFHLGSPSGVVAACEAITGLLFEGIFIAMLTQRFFGR